ncbi:hypothetical protein [Leifsonia sp. NPDC058230]|uniref:hypothetical protein n=1 Tax=Leifsonia sp. NPDC058230 TaxID=3346391 RepID=UPI0036DE7B92
MIPHFFAFLAAIGPLLAWCSVLILAIASLCCVLFALRSPRRPLVYVAAGLLALAVLISALPVPDAPPLFRVLIGLVVVALSIAGGGPASQLVLALASGGGVPGVHGGIVVAERATAGDRAEGVQPTREVLRGGATIGFLERLATTTTIMAGFPEAIAVIVAVKGVGRFTELEEPEARERFIIGTLTSLIWACACAAVFRLSFA